MLPQETIDLLKEEINLNHAPLHETRAYSSLLNNVNSFSEDELMNLNLIDSQTVENILVNRPFNDVNDLLDNITMGFSTHRKQRILSVLEVGIFKDEVHKYINSYPQKIRILGYKNEEVLKKFEHNLQNNLKGDNGKIWQ